MKTDIHPKYMDAEIRCACGNEIKTRSTKPVIVVGICNVCHPFYTGQQKFVDTAGRVDKFGCGHPQEKEVAFRYLSACALFRQNAGGFFFQSKCLRNLRFAIADGRIFRVAIHPS